MEPVRTPPSSSTEDEISEDLLNFFKQRSYSFADFTKRFPNLDFKRELERIINHPGLKDRHRYHARTHLKQLRSNQSRSSVSILLVPTLVSSLFHGQDPTSCFRLHGQDQLLFSVTGRTQLPVFGSHGQA